MSNLPEEWAEKPICNFSLRIWALILDMIFLGFLGVILGLLFGKFFAQMGGWGRTVGFVIALLYFGILNSVFGSGQTFGKKMAKIRVANRKGQPITLFQSLLRATILTLPFFLYRAMIPSNVLLYRFDYTVLVVAVYGER